MTSFPPVFWLSLALLLPGASSQAQAHVSCGLAQYHSVVTSAPSYPQVEREYPDIPHSLAFGEVREVEPQDDEDLPTGLTRFESQTWIETILHARRSSYLGHTPAGPTGTVRQDDRLRC